MQKIEAKIVGSIGRVRNRLSPVSDNLEWPQVCLVLCPPPSATERYRHSMSRMQLSVYAALVAFSGNGSGPCNLLILCANNLRDQEVDGSNPFAPTTPKWSGPDTWVTQRT